MKRPSKVTHVLAKVRECIDAGHYYDTRHATLRKSQRSISLADVLYVLRCGRHEKQKDVYHPEYHNWAYSVRGKTIDGRELRIVIAFDEDDMLIVTVIRIG